MIYLNTCEPKEEHMEITKKWIKKRPAQYRKLVNKCKKLAKDPNTNHYMIDIISNLVWNDVIEAERFMADSFSVIINEQYPELFAVSPKLKDSINISMEQFMQLLQANNVKIAV